MHKHINDPRFTAIIIDLMYEILDIYGADLLEDEDVGYQVEGIRRKVRKEIDQAGTAQTLIGLLDMVAQ